MRSLSLGSFLFADIEGETLGSVAHSRVAHRMCRRCRDRRLGSLPTLSSYCNARLFGTCVRTLRSLPGRLREMCIVDQCGRLARGRVTSGLRISIRAIGCQVNGTLRFFHVELGSFYLR